MTDKDLPTLRLEALSFPTDRITIEQLRRDQPDLFSEKGLFGKRGHDAAGWINVLAAMQSERVLAQKAFAAAAGQPDPQPDEDRHDQIDCMNEYYVRVGLSSGVRQTQQMARAIETAASQQFGPTQKRSR